MNAVREPVDPEGLANEPIDHMDLRVLSVLRDIAAANDPVPPGLADQARFAMTVAALEAEIAQISTESDLAGVRASEYDRATTITFASDQLSAMISIDRIHGTSARVSGWVTGGKVEVEIRERARTRVATTDDEGRFTFSGVERGLVHFLLRQVGRPDSHPVITPAIEI